MTYSYSGTPGYSNSDRLRFELGDVGLAGTAGGTVWMFTNEELDFIIGDESSWPLRIAHACEVLARQWARIPSFTVDGLRVDKGKVSEAYAARAKELRSSFGHVTYGEIDVTRKDGYSDDYGSYAASDSADTSATFDTLRYRSGFPLKFNG